MVRPAAAICAAFVLFAASILAPAASADTAYRAEHTDWGNDGGRNDRIYARDAVSGKHLVLSRQWGSRCHGRAALNYGLGGGCWYPVRARYLGWRRKPGGWVRLRP
jgi:hypothetical protein